MKNIFFKTLLILGLSLFSNKSLAQIEIIWGADNGNLPENFFSSGNYYYKDIPNYLDNFTGTWEYINGNEKFEVILTKVIMYHEIDADLNYNFYKDGIKIQYKKYHNGSLIFESPIVDYPSFKSIDGIVLKGFMIDYGRVTKSVYNLPVLGGELLKQGGEYFHPTCIIRKLNTPSDQPEKIKFNLYMRQSSFGETSNEDYDGLPTFSIPNNVILTKI